MASWPDCRGLSEGGGGGAVHGGAPCTAGQPEVQTAVFDVPLGPGKHPGPGIRISHSAVNLNDGWITEKEGNGGEVSFRRGGESEDGGGGGGGGG